LSNFADQKKFKCIFWLHKTRTAAAAAAAAAVEAAVAAAAAAAMAAAAAVCGGGCGGGCLPDSPLSMRDPQYGSNRGRWQRTGQ